MAPLMAGWSLGGIPARTQRSGSVAPSIPTE